MKKIKLYYKLKIDHKWFIWEPKRGPYKGKIKYVSKVTSWKKDNYLGFPVVLGGYKVKNGNIHMHVSSMSHYQFEENAKPLKDRKIIKEMEGQYKIYKKYWEEKRVVDAAKRVLMGGGKNVYC